MFLANYFKIPLLQAMVKSFYSSKNSEHLFNGKEATINRLLDGSTYPS
jgi:hypothetical protein